MFFRALIRLATAWGMLMVALLLYIILSIWHGSIPPHAKWPVILGVMFGPLAFVQTLRWCFSRQ